MGRQNEWGFADEEGCFPAVVPRPQTFSTRHFSGHTDSLRLENGCEETYTRNLRAEIRMHSSRALRGLLTAAGVRSEEVIKIITKANFQDAIAKKLSKWIDNSTYMLSFRKTSRMNRAEFCTVQCFTSPAMAPGSTGTSDQGTCSCTSPPSARAHPVISHPTPSYYIHHHSSSSLLPSFPVATGPTPAEGGPSRS